MAFVEGSIRNAHFARSPRVMDRPVADIRREYGLSHLGESDCDADPIRQFDRWFDDAVKTRMAEVNAMSLATVGADGQPSVRVVLLKGYDHRGFAFYTNYGSRKARELEANPRAALLIWWGELERQVRIEGVVSRTSDDESDAYFASRPRASQLGAIVSDQSRVIVGREVLEEKLGELAQRYENQPIPRPAGWGGYRLSPNMVEFWQGRENRLHDRLRYRREGDGPWLLERLSP